MNVIVFPVASRLRPHWRKLAALALLGFVCMPLFVLIGRPIPWLDTILFGLGGLGMVSCGLLFLVGLYQLSGPPLPTWSILRKVTVGLTGAFLLLWAVAATFLIAEGLLSPLWAS